MRASKLIGKIAVVTPLLLAVFIYFGHALILFSSSEPIATAILGLFGALGGVLIVTILRLRESPGLLAVFALLMGYLFYVGVAFILFSFWLTFAKYLIG